MASASSRTISLKEEMVLLVEDEEEEVEGFGRVEKICLVPGKEGLSEICGRDELC